MFEQQKWTCLNSKSSHKVKNDAIHMVAPTLQESFLKLQTRKRSDVSNDSIKTDERGGPGIDLDPAF